MDPLSLTASLIAVLQISGTVISALYEYRAAVKSASSDAARIIAELNSLRAILESLLQAVEFEDSTAGFSGSDGGGGGGGGARLANFQALTQPDGELRRCQADLEALSIKLHGDDPESHFGWRRVRRALVWPFKEKDVEKLLQGVQRAKSTMQFALSADQMALTLEIHEGVTHLTQQFVESSLDQRRQMILSWLAAPDPEPNHVAARKKRQPMTGDWFLAGETYESWKFSSGSFLWLYGIPGAGKSILCSTIIEDLLNRQTKSSFAVAFYYFDFNDVGKRDTTSLVRALVAQLVVKVPVSSKFFEDLSSRIDGKQPDVQFLLPILQGVILELDHVFIVVDALDECEDCEELMALIETINGWRHDRLHILVASRQLPEIEEVLVDCATSSVCLQNSINQDIHILIQERLTSDRKFQKWPYHVRREIDEALTARASGMFRWVVCQLDMLRNCITLPALRKALKSLPKTLDETYERILTNIDESYASDVRKILQFLTFSSRAMGLAELVEVLAVDLDAKEPQFDPENRVPNPNDILTICSTLVTTTDVTANLTTHKRLEVRLAHFSVKEYLLSERIKSSKAPMYSMDPISGMLFISQTYLVYLLSPQFSDGHCGLKGLEARHTAFPLFKAAVLEFPTHIGKADDQDDDKVDLVTKKLVQKLFSTRKNMNGGNYAAWVGGLIPEAETDTFAETPPLYYAASFGMTSIVKMLLADTPKCEIDIKGGRAQSTPLHVACFRGQAKCVRLLLEAGADPSSTNCKGESCLYWVRSRKSPKYKTIYNLLIQYGAGDHGKLVKGNRRMLEALAEKFEHTHLQSQTETFNDVLDSDFHEKEYIGLEAKKLLDVEGVDGIVKGIGASEPRHMLLKK